MTVHVDRPDRPTAEQILATARNPDGTPRFHPAGQHPAATTWRAELATLVDDRDGMTDPPRLLHEAIADLERRIAAVEIGEQAAKRAYLERAAR